jgi:hypothetical protein
MDRIFKDMDVACIGHKSLETCDQCRLRQQNSPTTPEIPLLFGEKSFETVCFDSFILIQALKQTRSVCFKSYLARNKRVDAYGA